MSKIQKYILEQLMEMNILETIHNYVLSAKSNIQNGHIETSINELTTIEDYIESLQDILMILPRLDKIEFDKK